ncbi:MULTISPECIES: hypothetical protein [unclassified Microbulbifer]|uniref:hypothetical protein n=1 Tax=unclassified Microbulbifer TaxID=2619833 RepID=UPI001E37CDFA|nr:hypothetical protein [Microbulbifer sp. YPW16]UHQ56785.1 hypothetical protein LVE68_07380 [Microbulbifer sp. YPW16]
MYKFTARTLLLLMLVTVFGQVAAQACVDMHGQVPAAVSLSGPGEASPAEGTAGMAGMDHCGESNIDPVSDNRDHCADPATAGDDCTQECTCCPGHCASAVPVAEDCASQPLRPVSDSTYREIVSSPVPESEFRPPITA